jgi:hypothetical protein
MIEGPLPLLIRKSGSSMAAPHVAGLCLLLREQNPDWDAKQIKQRISSTAEKRVSGFMPVS